MKRFYFDVLLDEENICNLKKEKRKIEEGISGGKKLVIYGPRNCGKTSLVKNVILPKFHKHEKGFTFFCDLMEVKSLEAISQRVSKSFEEAFAANFPGKKLLQAMKDFILDLRPKMEYDPVTGAPSVSLGSPNTRQKQIPFTEILTTIRKNISPKNKVLMVFDEFQDIAFVPEAQGLFRQALQEFKNISVILMGSKKHLLSQILAEPRAPLAFFGEDIEFGPIDYKEYHEYIEERFEARHLKISFEDCKDLQDTLFRIPEAINIVCSKMNDTFEKKTLNSEDIHNSIVQILADRQTRYEEFLAHFSEKEEQILVTIAKTKYVLQPTGQAFLNQVSLSVRAIGQIFKKMTDKSILEKTKEGYRIADPLLSFYLQKFR